MPDILSVSIARSALIIPTYLQLSAVLAVARSFTLFRSVVDRYFITQTTTKPVWLFPSLSDAILKFTVPISRTRSSIRQPHFSIAPLVHLSRNYCMVAYLNSTTDCQFFVSFSFIIDVYTLADARALSIAAPLAGLFVYFNRRLISPTIFPISRSSVFMLCSHSFIPRVF